MPSSNALGFVGAPPPAPRPVVVHPLDPPPRPLWKGNWNAWWILGTTLGLWFLFVYTPLHPPVFDSLFVLHLVPAGAVYLICMWNTFHTPSHGPRYRVAHVWLGRTAIVLGVLGYAFGLIVAWPEGRAPIGLAIGLTIGGAAQMITGFLGLYFIRQKNTTAHILCMCGLFLAACGTPAAMRLGLVLGIPFGVGLPLFVTLLVLAIFPMTKAIQNNRWV